MKRMIKYNERCLEDRHLSWRFHPFSSWPSLEGLVLTMYSRIEIIVLITEMNDCEWLHTTFFSAKCTLIFSRCQWKDTWSLHPCLVVVVIDGMSIKKRTCLTVQSVFSTPLCFLRRQRQEDRGCFSCSLCDCSVRDWSIKWRTDFFISFLQTQTPDFLSSHIFIFVYWKWHLILDIKKEKTDLRTTSFHQRIQMGCWNKSSLSLRWVKSLKLSLLILVSCLFSVEGLIVVEFLVI